MALETDIPIGAAQQRIESSPLAPLKPPKARGPFILDQNVIDCMYTWLVTIQSRLPYPENAHSQQRFLWLG
jgi:hypothetical protein